MLGILITACVVLAAAQAAIAVLAMLALGGVVYGLFVAPRETLALLGMMVLGSAFQAYPLLFLGVVGLIALIGKLKFG